VILDFYKGIWQGQEGKFTESAIKRLRNA